jgi:hypothetical protein
MLLTRVQAIPVWKHGSHLDSVFVVSPEGWITSKLCITWHPVFLLNTVMTLVHCLYIIKLSTLEIFYAIYLDIMELGNHS